MELKVEYQKAKGVTSAVMNNFRRKRRIEVPQNVIDSLMSANFCDSKTNLQAELLYDHGCLPQGSCPSSYYAMETKLHITHEKILKAIKEKGGKVDVDDQEYDELLKKQLSTTPFNKPPVKERKPDKCMEVLPTGLVRIHLKSREILVHPVTVPIVRTSDECVQQVISSYSRPNFNDHFYMEMGRKYAVKLMSGESKVDNEGKTSKTSEEKVEIVKAVEICKPQETKLNETSTVSLANKVKLVKSKGVTNPQEPKMNESSSIKKSSTKKAKALKTTEVNKPTVHKLDVPKVCKEKTKSLRVTGAAVKSTKTEKWIKHKLNIPKKHHISTNKSSAVGATFKLLREVIKPTQSKLEVSNLSSVSTKKSSIFWNSFKIPKLKRTNGCNKMSFDDLKPLDEIDSKLKAVKVQDSILRKNQGKSKCTATTTVSFDMPDLDRFGCEIARPWSSSPITLDNEMESFSEDEEDQAETLSDVKDVHNNTIVPIDEDDEDILVLTAEAECDFL